MLPECFFSLFSYWLIFKRLQGLFLFFSNSTVVENWACVHVAVPVSYMICKHACNLSIGAVV